MCVKHVKLSLCVSAYCRCVYFSVRMCARRACDASLCVHRVYMYICMCVEGIWMRDSVLLKKWVLSRRSKIYPPHTYMKANSSFSMWCTGLDTGTEYRFQIQACKLCVHCQCLYTFCVLMWVYMCDTFSVCKCVCVCDTFCVRMCVCVCVHVCDTFCVDTFRFMYGLHIEPVGILCLSCQYFTLQHCLETQIHNINSNVPEN